MTKLELTVSLVFALILWNWKNLLPDSRWTNASPSESAIAHIDVTYVPEVSLTDSESWSAWKTQVKKSNTTQAYVRKSSPQTSSPAPSGSASSSSASSADRGHSVAVTPTQKLWEGESWSDGITIEDPNSPMLAEGSETSHSGLGDGGNSEISPNLLPNILDPETRRAPAEPSMAVARAVSSQLQPEPQPLFSVKDKMTVVPVPVTVASPSQSSRLASLPDSMTDREESVGADAFPSGVLLPSLIGLGGVVGVGYFWLKRGNRHPKTELFGSHGK
ncbi:MAG TPA: hypothetical protein IGS17_21620 [Oscillatoriales cyanobacterium M59_W2019_021]|nr:hypothetical protein [Oscillatoriales cyanobacterium M59_W2019_021]